MRLESVLRLRCNFPDCDKKVSILLSSQQPEPAPNLSSDNGGILC